MAAKVVALLLLSMAPAVTHAHEIRPAVMDVAVGETVRGEVDLNAEAILAGIDLSAYEDTNEAPQAEAYDRLRALDAEALAAAVADAWPRIAEGLTLEGAGRPDLLAVEVGPDPGPDLPRDTRVVFEAPMEGEAVRIGWAEAYGELILREVSDAPEPYAGILPLGGTSPALTAQGGADVGETLLAAVVSGFEHIVPKGLDHILFVLGIFFYALRWSPILWQVTAFTLAHTVTLALAATGTVPVDAAIVEPLIALSIVWIALENVFLRRERIGWGRIAVVFGFGLLHGLGFSLVFAEAMEGRNFVLSLVGFNVGVELGQLAVIAVAFALVALPPRRYFVRDVHDAVSQPASYVIAIIGIWWVVERTLLG